MRQALHQTIQGMNEWSEVSENPYTGASTLHPNAKLPISVTWTLQDTMTRFAVLVSGYCEICNRDYTGEIMLTAMIEQNGNCTVRDFCIRAGHGIPWGLAFENDQTPYTLTLSIRLGEGAEIGGSAVAFSSISAMQPIHENGNCQLFKVYSAGEKSAGALINANQGGLMNRLISLFSVICVAKQTGRDAYVWWGNNAHCAARFQDIFEAGVLTDPSFIAEDAEIFTMYESNQTALDLTSCKRNVIVHAVTPIKTQPSYANGHPEIAAEFRKTTLAAPVRAILSRFNHVDFSRCIAFHIRRPFPGGAFAELENSKFTLGLDVFKNLISGLKRDFHEFDRVLVCTNNFDVEKEIRQALGDYVFFFDKTTIDNTVEAKAVQEAMVDVMLMSRCPILFSQETTAFGFFAHLAGDNIMLAVLKSSTPEDIKLWRFDKGTVVDSIDVAVSDLSPLYHKVTQVLAVES